MYRISFIHSFVQSFFPILICYCCIQQFCIRFFFIILNIIDLQCHTLSSSTFIFYLCDKIINVCVHKCTSFMVTHTTFIGVQKVFVVLFHHHHQMVRKNEKFKTFQKKNHYVFQEHTILHKHTGNSKLSESFFICLFICLSILLIIVIWKKNKKAHYFPKKETEREWEKILKYLKYTSVTQLVKKRITNDNQTHTHTHRISDFVFVLKWLM